MTQSDETITFFPTYGRREAADGPWQVNVHAWTYRRGERRRFSRLLLAALNRGLRLDPDEEGSGILRARLSPFLAHEGDAGRIGVRIGDAVHNLPEPDSDGHIRGVIEWKEPDRHHVDDSGHGGGVTTCAGPGVRRVDFHVESGSIGEGVRGHALLVEAEGISVISDLDDTVKHTNVLVRRELLANTFLRPFRAIPGMAEAFAEFAAAGAAFHYVSASPWQLAESITDFLDESGFPQGTFHLRAFRLRRGGLVRFLKHSATAKLDAVKRIVEDFPHRRFVLVGDSGERDPEIYGEVARRFPDRIERIFIRNATVEPANGQRFREAFRDVSPGVWELFRDPASMT